MKYKYNLFSWYETIEAMNPEEGLSLIKDGYFHGALSALLCIKYAADARTNRTLGRDDPEVFNNGRLAEMERIKAIAEDLINELKTRF